MDKMSRYEYQKARNQRLGFIRVSVDVPAESVKDIIDTAYQMRKYAFEKPDRDPLLEWMRYKNRRPQIRQDGFDRVATRYTPPTPRDPNTPPAPYPGLYPPPPYEPQDPTAPAPATYKRSTPEELQVVRRELEKIDALEAQMIAEGRPIRTMGPSPTQTPEDPPTDQADPTATPSWV